MPVAEFVGLVGEPGEEIAVVRDQDERPVEGFEGLFEDGFRADVQVVGRLVHDQYVEGAHQQFAQRQTAAFPTREDFHLFLDRIARKEETAQQVAGLGTHGFGGFVLDGADQGLFHVEALLLVLSVIPHVDVVSAFDGALVVDLAQQTAHEGGLALPVLAHEGDLVAALRLKVDALEHLLGRVFDGRFHPVAVDPPRGVGKGLVDVLGPKNDLPGRAVHLKTQVHGGYIVGIDLDEFLFLQPFHQALGKGCLGGLVTETLDELFGLADFLFLVLAGGELLFPDLGAEFQVFGIGLLVVVNAPAGYLDGAVGYIVQESTVVAHQHHRAGEAGEEVLEPEDGLDVQVVGRLVQEQDIVLLEQQFGQFDAHAPTAGKQAGVLVEIRAFEAQSQQHAFDLPGIGVSSGQIVPVREVVELFDELHVGLALVVGAHGQEMVYLLEAFFDGFQFDERTFDLAHQGVPVLEIDILTQDPHPHRTVVGEFAFVGAQIAGEYAQQGGLAGSVFACQTDAVALVDAKAHAREQRLPGKINSYVVGR